MANLYKYINKIVDFVAVLVCSAVSFQAADLFHPLDKIHVTDRQRFFFFWFGKNSFASIFNKFLKMDE